MANTYYDSQLTAAEIEQVLEAISGILASANNGKVLAISDGTIEARSVQWGGGEAVLESLSVTENGDYYPEAGVDGFDEVHVSVPNSYTASDEGKVVSNGALVAQTARASQITQNGTYDTTMNNEVTVNVSGGGSAVVQPLSVTQNGTYNPPSGVDGYAPVTVNVSGGGGSIYPVEIDFTKADFTIGNVAFSSAGATFDGTSDYIVLPFARSGMTIELDVAMMQLASGTHRRFLMATFDKGLIYRSTGVWAFYNGNWENSEITDGNFFDNCTVKLHVDNNNKWHLYKDGVLIFEPEGAQAVGSYCGSSSYQIFGIGSSSTSINNTIITKARIY